MNMTTLVLPPLDHLDRMTDSTGLIQHAIHGIPRRESGYTTDDNARALRLCARLWAIEPNDRLLARVTCHLSFLEHARGSVHGFHNFLSYRRDWLDVSGTDDCQGQAVLALAEVLASPLPDGCRAVAGELIASELPALGAMRSLRAQAYCIIAWGMLRECGDAYAGGLEAVARHAADRLVECHDRARRPDWAWFESRMTYANAVLPHALFVAADRWPEEGYLTAAESSFALLDRVTTVDGVFWPIGNRDWYSHGEEKSPYDQQPVEASTMAEAALAAVATRGDLAPMATFRRAVGWFSGQNSLGIPLGDTVTGGCFDGLTPTGVNRNQGAESTLAYLWTELLAATADRRPATGEASLVPPRQPSPDPRRHAVASHPRH
jgi:hypothetical protein